MICGRCVLPTQNHAGFGDYLTLLEKSVKDVAGEGRNIFCLLYSQSVLELYKLCTLLPYVIVLADNTFVEAIE